LDIGVTGARPPALDASQLPLFTLTCTSGPAAGQKSTVTDPGRAMTTGSCADIGKTKVPVLRGLAARAPYFHTVTGRDVGAVVGVYDRRFNIPFTAQERTDLVNFLRAL